LTNTLSLIGSIKFDESENYIIDKILL